LFGFNKLVGALYEGVLTWLLWSFCSFCVVFLWRAIFSAR
jgi:hypothetical protein